MEPNIKDQQVSLWTFSVEKNLSFSIFFQYLPMNASQQKEKLMEYILIVIYFEL